MKNIIYIFILVLNLSVYAQQQTGGGQRGGRQNGQGQQNRELKEFKASEVAGLFFYDIKKITKKLKLKDNEKKTSVTKLLKDYNFKIKEISLKNADTFSDLNKIVNAGIKSRKDLGNSDSNTSNKGIRAKVQEIIRPIRQKVRQKEINLNAALANVLTEKQNKKWLKHQKTKKDKLKPKKTERNNNQRQNRNQNRQRGGF